ncbi:putative alpha-1,3-mannosyltransferase Mnt4p [[Candida] railenensis]|uniref:Alpha-1,3-mannosyltransferase Mnt4p n=1 Tax=[Candida] railenensis TaxID=45579 RepID=A0A9P0QRW1_9ASCO|nr:putative alpha-1,3-mannosyltransferase Mnt4p [[Candida] railenensis]
MSSLSNKIRYLAPVRQKRTLLLLICAILLFIALGSLKSLSLTNLHQNKNTEIDIQSERSKITNPGYRNFGTREHESSMGDKCTLYFQDLAKSSYPGINLQDMEAKGFNTLAYRKDKWIKKYRRDLKLQLKRQKAQYTNEHDAEGMRRLLEESMKIVQIETKMTLDFNHMRVFGSCLAANAIENVKNVQSVESEIFPWLSTKCPKFEDMSGNVLEYGKTPSNSESSPFSEAEKRSFLQYWKDTSSGKGIVIPITKNENIQVDHIKRLLRTFSSLKNTLPIQILYINNDVGFKESIIQAAKESNQAVWFVDLSPVIASSLIENKNGVVYSPNFILGLSTIFHSFEDAVILSYQAIPLLEDFANKLFESENYLYYGLKFFKKPSYQTLKRTKFPDGFFEVTNLIRTQLMPNKDDSRVFGMFQRSEKISSTKRVLEDTFQEYIDPNMMVINKVKVMSGLLVGCNLQFYRMFNVRFDEQWPVRQPEFLWLGQEIAGTNQKVNFNAYHGTGMGVLTPALKKPTKVVTTSEELCSSSWGQIDEKDAFTLLYLTSHQAENWKSIKKFQLDLEEKFGIPITKEIKNNMDTSGDEPGMLTITDNNYELFRNTFEKNVLTVNDVMIPATINKNAGEMNSVEPKFAWLQQREFGAGGHMYWCCYNVVGKVGIGKEGMIIKYSEQDRERMNRITSVWMKDV